MAHTRAGGGWAAIWYTFAKSWGASTGALDFWRRMASKNTCKTCALGMGGQAGGMRNEAGHFPEFCKKSVQAMAADLQPPIDAMLFHTRTVDELARYSPRQLENLGRLAFPLLREAGQARYRRISWDEALDRAAGAMRATTPDRTFFYSSGRSSNEAAFLLQWLARVYGTNNVNNCSYYCHQASGVGLSHSIGSGVATVTLDDLAHADFALLQGANPASNHPRLIAHLVDLRQRGGQVIVVNPLWEPGLHRFHVPSKPLSLLAGSRVSDLYVQPRIGGDIAFLKGLLQVVIRENALDRAFIDAHTIGFDALRADVERESLTDLAANAAVPVDTILDVARRYARARNAVFLWAMGITHHEHGVDNVTAIANLALARGMVGRPHAGLMPIRGHSNVQGVGSVGFTPQLRENFLRAMQEHYGLKPPPGKGLDSMQSLLAAQEGNIDFALFLGGNFYASNPDSHFARGALSQIHTAVHINTKLNQGHVCVEPQRAGGSVLILPTCARDEETQATTQESGFSFVRLSEGGMKHPPASELKSEVEIITSLGARLLPADGPIDFRRLRDHNAVREAIARVVPGYAPIANISETKEEFHVGGRVRHQPVFPTSDGKARFLIVATPAAPLEPGQLRLMTIRSEGQFNTVVYEEEDRYRGQAARDVIFLNAADLRAHGLRDGDRVTVRSAVGQMSGVRVAEYRIAPGCAAMYYPESNVLVKRGVDTKSGTPSFKNVTVTIERSR
jgi:molybdopterin-dependent oxidoreductase alpha subunit